VHCDTDLCNTDHLDAFRSRHASMPQPSSNTHNTTCYEGVRCRGYVHLTRIPSQPSSSQRCITCSGVPSVAIAECPAQALVYGWEVVLEREVPGYQRRDLGSVAHWVAEPW
jgi:hypothetical protein